MNVRYRVELTPYERHELGALLSGGKQAARKLKRAQILLAADAGIGDEEIAGSGARFLAQRPLQVAFDEPPLGPVHRRAADPDAAGDLLVADPASAASRICARLSFRAACSPPGRQFQRH
jgi:hypothetical protein